MTFCSFVIIILEVVMILCSLPLPFSLCLPPPFLPPSPLPPCHTVYIFTSWARLHRLRIFSELLPSQVTYILFYSRSINSPLGASLHTYTAIHNHATSHLHMLTCCPVPCQQLAVVHTYIHSLVPRLEEGGGGESLGTRLQPYMACSCTIFAC